MKKVLSCLADGILQGCIFILLTEYAVSVYFKYISIYNIVIFAASLLLSILSTFILVNKCVVNLWKGYLTSGISFVSVLLLSFINLLTFKIRLFPIRETSNADGFYIFYFGAGFILFLLVFRLINILIYLIVKWHRKRTGDGSVS